MSSSTKLKTGKGRTDAQVAVRYTTLTRKILGMKNKMCTAGISFEYG